MNVLCDYGHEGEIIVRTIYQWSAYVYVWVNDYWIVCKKVGVCKFFFPGLHAQKNSFYKLLNITSISVIFRTRSLFSPASFICCWRAPGPPSTSESCCLWCRPLVEALWTTDCGCHSLLDTRDQWTRCVAQCGFRLHHLLWFCGKPGCRSSCSWCSCSANCAKPGTRRCKAIRWPLWQG